MKLRSSSGWGTSTQKPRSFRWPSSTSSSGARIDPQLSPHEWAIGHTFEYTFDLAKPDNAGNRSTKAKQKPSRKPQRKNTSKSTQKAGKPARRPEPTPAETEAKREKRLEHDHRRNQSEKRREYHRNRAQEQREKAKELGKCRNCSKPAILSQTRCPRCAEAHRQSRRLSDARRRAMDRGMESAEEWSTPSPM